MQAQIQVIYPMLREVARAGGHVHYADVGHMVGLDMAHLPDRTIMGHILDAIGQAEHDECRPLLPAVVILRETHVPGDGFFDLARQLGLLQPRADELEFFVEELRRVHEYWAGH